VLGKALKECEELTRKNVEMTRRNEQLSEECRRYQEQFKRMEEKIAHLKHEIDERNRQASRTRCQPMQLPLCMIKNLKRAFRGRNHQRS